jgi:thymidylate synthase (FAD)
MRITLLSITPFSERTIEQAGRTAWQSFNKEKDTPDEFIRMLLRLGHLSVLEHASATFRIEGISRACTHQLVRHRLCSFTQKSQRYVSEADFSYTIPLTIVNNKLALSEYTACMEEIKKTYLLLRSLSIPKEDARFILPNATNSEIVVTANFRQWRHVLEERLHPTAQWEIREMASKILMLLKEHAPTVFEDLPKKGKP